MLNAMRRAGRVGSGGGLRELGSTNGCLIAAKVVICGVPLHISRGRFFLLVLSYHNLGCYSISA